MVKSNHELAEGPDLKVQIAKLVSEAEGRAFARGLERAIEVLHAELSTLDALGRTNTPRASGRSETGTMALVLEAITKQPGLKGVELYRWLEGRGTPVAERTVRTNLRRLRQDRLVWQRDKRWYPKNAKNPEGEDTESDTLL